MSHTHIDKSQLAEELKEAIHSLSLSIGMDAVEARNKAIIDSNHLLDELQLLDDSDTAALVALRETVNNLQVMAKLANPPLPAGFPVNKSFRQRRRWLSQQLAADLQTLPADVSAGEVRQVYDVYYKPLLRSPEKMQFSKQQQAQIIVLLDKQLRQRQLALPASPDEIALSSHALFLSRPQANMPPLNRTQRLIAMMALAILALLLVIVQLLLP